MHSPDLSRQNVKKLTELFPNCVTETRDENGELVSSIDFDLLRQELSDHIVEGPQERYRLDWPGKREAQLTANAPIAKTLRPARDESVDFDTTKNLFIEGDNLDALKLLQETYLNKVKMIYIDPPYNTGEDFVFKDDYAEDTTSYLRRSNQVDDEGNRLVDNAETNGRFHSDWLNMMYPRLKLARNLLRDDGVIFISVDDNEQANVKRLCDEVFGEKNLLGVILWKKKNNGNNVGSIPSVHDYIIAFTRSDKDKAVLGFPLDNSFIERTYSNPDNDPKGDWTTSDLSANHKGPYFAIKNPSTNEVFFPPKGRYWVFNENEVKKRIAEGRIIFGKNGKSAPVQKNYLVDRASMRTKADSWWDNKGRNSDATREISMLFSPKFFDHPKPVNLIKNLLNISTTNEDIILDFFAGSGTTAHSMMQLNAEDGGKRRCISIQLPELTDEKSGAYKFGYKTIAEISKERIRRAGEKIKKENPDADLDIGFRVLKVDTSNMEDVYYFPDEVEQADLLADINNIKPDRTAEDLLFQVLLDWGVDLTLPIAKENIHGKSVYFVDDNALVACFEQGIDEALVKELAQRHPMRVVFRDNGFASDAVKINITQIFKLMSPDTDVRTI